MTFSPIGALGLIKITSEVINTLDSPGSSSPTLGLPPSMAVIIPSSMVTNSLAVVIVPAKLGDVSELLFTNSIFKYTFSCPGKNDPGPTETLLTVKSQLASSSSKHAVKHSIVDRTDNNITIRLNLIILVRQPLDIFWPFVSERSSCPPIAVPTVSGPVGELESGLLECSPFQYHYA